MPSIFSHAVASVALGKASFIKAEGSKFWLLAATCAIIPDVDGIGFQLGVPYDSMFGHRGFTHSFFFAALFSLIVVSAFYRQYQRFSSKWWIYFAFFFVVTASHPVLDAMTNGGKGVAFFAPFSNERYFFPFRPIQVSPMTAARFFSEHGLKVMKSEFIWVWIPSFAIIVFTTLINKLRTR
jgi:inner membrane protein